MSALPDSLGDWLLAEYGCTSLIALRLARAAVLGMSLAGLAACQQADDASLDAKIARAEAAAERAVRAASAAERAASATGAKITPTSFSDDETFEPEVIEDPVDAEPSPDTGDDEATDNTIAEAGPAPANASAPPA